MVDQFFIGSARTALESTWTSAIMEFWPARDWMKNFRI